MIGSLGLSSLAQMLELSKSKSTQEVPEIDCEWRELASMICAIKVHAPMFMIALLFWKTFMFSQIAEAAKCATNPCLRTDKKLDDIEFQKHFEHEVIFVLHVCSRVCQKIALLLASHVGY